MGVLTKLSDQVLVVPYVPAVPAVAAVAFHMFATPPPRGFTYRQLANGQPNSAGSFNNWSQLTEAPVEYSQSSGGYIFKTLTQLLAEAAALGYSGISIPGNSIPVYRTAPGGFSPELYGYQIPVFNSQPLPPRYYGPIAHMTFVQFDGPTATNGYPLASGDIEGYFDIPTVDGIQRITRTYRKDGRGVWLPINYGPDPQYCKTHGSCKVVMFSGFPGRPAGPARAASYETDYNLGWNAGANSVERLDGDVRTTFTVGITAAGSVGFAPDAERDAGNYQNLTHAFYFDNSPVTGKPRATIAESGRIVGAAYECAEGTEFTIERIEGVVHYRIDGELVGISNAISGGVLMVGTSLYRGGDTVG